MISLLKFNKLIHFASQTCKTWSHFRCQNVAKSERKLWTDENLSFYCTVCRSTESNKFDYEKGLNRLRADASVGFVQLKQGVRREHLAAAKKCTCRRV